MISKRLGGLCAAVGFALGLGGCVDDYGYGGLEVGYGNAGYYGDPYGYGYDGYGYGGYGYGGYAPSYFGWYNDFYYPGTGIYVYDQYRRPYRWNDTQRRYWSARQRYRGRDWNGQGSWNGFDRRNLPNRGYDGNRQWQQNPNVTPGVRNDQNTPGAGTYRRNPDWQGGRRSPDGQRFRGNPGGQGYQQAPGGQRFRGNPGGQGYQRAPDAQRFQGTPGGGAGRSFTAPSGSGGRGQWSGGRSSDNRPQRGAERPQ